MSWRSRSFSDEFPPQKPDALRRTGRWLEVPLTEAVFDLAIELARAHVTELGCRTFDTLPVASALELGAHELRSFDQGQEKLAKAAKPSTS